MNNHGDYADIGDLVEVYNAGGLPTGYVGLITDVHMRGSFHQNIKYVKIKVPHIDHDWHLASFVRILSSARKDNV